MPDISSVGLGPLGPIGRSAASDHHRPSSQSPSAVPGRTDASPRADRLELSEQARLLATLKSLPDVRTNLVARVRHQIATGTYENPQKLETALDRLIDELA